ncbi:hypothetical protein AAY473_008538 [Plecturocebus cupreus]
MVLSHQDRIHPFSSFNMTVYLQLLRTLERSLAYRQAGVQWRVPAHCNFVSVSSNSPASASRVAGTTGTHHPSG